MGLSNAKCKVHLAYRPIIHLATWWLKRGEAKFFWHSATVPSHMWDGTVALCQNNLVYFNPFKSFSLLLQYQVFALSSLLSLSPLSSFSLSLRSPSRYHQASLFSPNHQAAVTKPMPNANSPSPISKSLLSIHSSHKANTLDTHLTFHSITLSSNRHSCMCRWPSLFKPTKPTSFKLPSGKSASFELQQNRATQRRIKQSSFHKFLLCLWVKIVWLHSG